MFDRFINTLVNTLDRSLPAWLKRRIQAASPQLVEVIYRELAKRTSDRPVRVIVQSGPLAGRPFVCSLKHQRSCYLGNFEPWTMELLEKNLPSGSVFFDVGAHIGYFSLIAAIRLGSSGTVVAFEPEPDNVEQFKANTTLNADIARSIRLEEAAVSNAIGSATFERGSNSYVGHLSRVEDEQRKPETAVAVRTVTLDDFVTSSGFRPSLVKIDVEGAESLVFDGMSRTLTEDRPVLLVELHTAECHGAFLKLLDRYSYVGRRAKDQTAFTTNPGWDGAADFVAMPR
jgi:FkbM family methyltransferase